MKHPQRPNQPTGGYPPAVRFLIALGLLGAAMFAVPRIALPLGVILVLGALLSNKTDAAGPIKEFGHLLYGD